MAVSALPAPHLHELETVCRPTAVEPRTRLRRDINLILNVTLPVLLILSFMTGWVASWMGLTEFGLHKYTSIAVFVVAFGHLGLHWRSLMAHMRRLRVGARPKT
jgi:ABC-type transporter Mla maintaining outer membrane lipid asymmetry permease subunit MlaE